MTLPLVLVGVATFRRKDPLNDCLASLAVQAPHPHCRVVVVVADNNPDGMASEVVNAWQDRFPWPLHYVTEPRQGLAEVRNRIIAHALEIEADYVAFLDDDETADPDWLYHLHDVIATTEAHAVQGAVRYVPLECGGGTPPPFTTEHAELEAVKIPYTNNVIFSATLIRDWGLRFDERFSLTGGEDYDFFLRSHLRGGVHLWTNKALVSEPVPCARQQVSYRLRRVFRSAASKALSERLRIGKSIVVKRIRKSLRQILRGTVNVLLAPLSILMGCASFRSRLFVGCGRVAKGSGGLAGMLGWNIRMYK
ncbi:MAG TPA: glycosyltransferase family 2 protein [Rhodocyclaceae bacterium]|nr:glycosyltransferase family 2 protein [Rhodocyclaceae bacterium]HRQ45630.1 glycosyltransferase family 2 protein [Rhodocyclaceae bacterium]